MIIDRKKWQESGSVSDKLKFIKAVFEIINLEHDFVEKSDLILMCEFLLEEVKKNERTNDLD